MAETQNNIVFKLIIDGQPATATLDIVKGEFLEAGAAADQGSEIIKKGYQELSVEAAKYTEVTEGNVAALTQFLSTQNISADMIEKQIALLQNEAKILDINSEAWRQKMTAATNLKAAYGQMINNTTSLNSTNQAAMPGVNNMTMAIGQFGWALGDANMFMVNARMGMMSIANNIPMVVQAFLQARAAAGGQVSAMQQITQALMGGGGLLLGINALMFVLQILPGLFGNTTKAMTDQKDEMKKLSDEYKKLSLTELEGEKASLETLKRGYEAQRKEIESRRQIVYEQNERSGNYGKVKEILWGRSDDEERYKKLKEGYTKDDKFIEGIDQINEKLKNANQAILTTKENLTRVVTGKYPLDSIFNIGEAIKILDQQIEHTTDTAERKGLETIRTQLDKLKKSMNPDDKSESEAKKFAEEKSRAITDLVKDEYEQQERERLNTIEYRNLIDEKIKKEEELKTIHENIRNAKSHAELVGYQVQKDLTEKSIKLLDDQMKKEEEKNDKLVESYRKEREEKTKGIISEQDHQKDKAKWEQESSYKFEDNAIDRQKKELDVEEAQSIQRAELFGATEEQKTNIHRYYSKQREKIEQQQFTVTLTSASQMLGQLAGMFGKQTAAYKVLATAQVWIETYKGIAALYAPPPVGVGPVLAPFMTGALLAMGGLQTANIMKTNTSMPGYARGGAIVGEKGVEIIAPAQDYATGMAELVNRTVLEVQNYFSSGNSAGNAQLINEIRMMREELGNPGISFFNEREFEKARKEVEYKNAKRKF